MIYDILIINWITLEKEIFISKRDIRLRSRDNGKIVRFVNLRRVAVN